MSKEKNPIIVTTCKGKQEQQPKRKGAFISCIDRYNDNNSYINNWNNFYITMLSAEISYKAKASIPSTKADITKTIHEAIG